MPEFELPLRLQSLTNAREHWSKRAKRAKQERFIAKAHTPHLVQLPCEVRLTRIAPRALDDDNLRAACKSVRDGIADRLGIDDRDPQVTWTYAQACGTQPHQYGVRVMIVSLPSVSPT